MLAEECINARSKRYAKPATGTGGWDTSDVIMLAGEIGYDTTNGKIKVGDGTNTWNNLSYFETGAPSTGAIQTFYISGTAAFGLTKPQSDISVQYSLATLSTAVSKEFTYTPASAITISPTSLYDMYIMLSNLAVSTSIYTISTSLKKGDTEISYGTILLTPSATAQIVHIPMNTNYISSEVGVSTSESLSLVISIARSGASSASHNVNFISASSAPSFFIKNGGQVGANVVLDEYGGSVQTQSQINASLSASKLGVSGNASDVTVAFNEAMSRTNVETGDTASTLFGKIKKFFSDLGALAFKSAVVESDITDSNVTTAKIANLAVTTAKIADANITKDKLGANAVTTSKIADTNVTTAKIADLAVTTGKIVDANITEEKLNAGAVTTSKIADINVTTPKIANSAVTTGKIAPNAVTNEKLAPMVTGTLKGRTGNSDGTPSDLTAADVMTMLGAATSTHSHGSITYDGKIGGDPDHFLYTGARGLIGVKSVAETQSLLGVGALVSSITYYVDTTGSDSNNGTSSSTPFRNIQHAVDLLPATASGDYSAAIVVAAGTYSETVSIVNKNYIVRIIADTNRSTINFLNIVNSIVLVSGNLIVATPYTTSATSAISITYNGLLMFNNSTITATNNSTSTSSSCVFIAHGGKVTYVSNGAFELSGNGYGIRMYGRTEASMSSLTVTNASQAINMSGGTLQVGGNISLDAASYGIYAQNAIMQVQGNLAIADPQTAISVNGSIVEVSGNYRDLAKSSSLSLTGGLMQVGGTCTCANTKNITNGARLYTTPEMTIRKVTVTLVSGSSWRSSGITHTQTVTVNGITSSSIISFCQSANPMPSMISSTTVSQMTISSIDIDSVTFQATTGSSVPPSYMIYLDLIVINNS